jgi:phosphopantothenoylcysteine decarboxylase/phosphopantothenate--cysteine ligase
MAAAVADYTPEQGPASAKLPKADAPLQITLVRTSDILQELGRARGEAARPVLVGFAAETGDPRPRARQKLARKQVDLIVANDISREDAGFDVETNAAVLIDAHGEVETPLQSKSVLASTILDRIERLLASPAAQPARS